VNSDKDYTERLVQAAFEGKMEEVRDLVHLGADIDAVGRNWNPLHAAIENMNVEIVRYLLGEGADPNFMYGGMRPLHHAIDVEADSASQANALPPKPMITAALLDGGADPDALDERGRSPLKMAIDRGHDSAARLLRSHGQERQLPR
jgi:uncharacterized protein